MGDRCSVPRRPASAWVLHWAPLIETGTVLDVASGSGRHSQVFLDRGLTVVAIDREAHEIPGARFIQADLEGGDPWPVGGERFDGIVVTNYLHRPLFPVIREALKPGGILIYETFMVGHERYRAPSNPDFLLHPDELLHAFDDLEVLGFEQGDVELPKPAVTQRFCGRAPAGA